MKGVTINPKGFHKGQIKFYVVLIPLALFMALPIVYIISHAFKPPSELSAVGDFTKNLGGNANNSLGGLKA